MSILYTIAVFLLVLGLMIFVHEFGHYLTAKWSNVKVLEFALGMGPKLYGVVRGETEYKLCALPIGGYVKMLGEEPGETDEDKIPEKEAHRAFINQPPHRRIMITVAGPLLNIVLAVILAPAIYMLGIDVPAYNYEKPSIGAVNEGSPAKAAGFLEGDEVVSAGDEKFEKWSDFNEFLLLNPGKTFEYTVIRDGKKVALTMTLGRDEKHGIGYSGLVPRLKTINAVGDFASVSPAKEAGMKVGDRIVAIEGKKIETWSQIVANIRNAGQKPLKIDVMRNGRRMTFNITPRYDEGEKAYLIGIAPQIDYVHVQYPFGRAVVEGMGFLGKQIALAGVAIKKLVTGELGRKALGGPVEIAVQVGNAARMGFSYLVQLTAIISVWLGLINLFPIPALDGGHIMFSSLEIISRRRLNQKALDIMNTVGFALLITLILLVSAQDVARHWNGIVDWFHSLAG